MQNIERILQIDLLLNDKSYIFQTSTYNLQNRFWFIRKIIEWNLNFRSLGKCGNDTTNNNKGKLFFSSHIRQPLFLLCLENTACGRYKTINDWSLHFLFSYIYISFLHFFMLLIGSIEIVVFFKCYISHIAYIFFEKLQAFEF